LGTAGPLALIPGLDETFIVLNGDVLTTLDIKDLIKFHKEQKATATISMNVRNVKIDLGVISCNGDYSIKEYTEKPEFHYNVSMGVYVFESTVLQYISRGEYLDFPNLVNILLAANERVVGYPFNGYWQDLGRKDDYEQASIDFENMRHLFIKEE
jgi:NDP-sugar pyrophosphorylase family protein